VPSKALVSALIAATFVTRFRIPVFGHHFLIEHPVAILTLLSLMLNGWGRRLTEAARSTPSLIFLGYIAWGCVTSVISAPEVGASLSIAVWLFFSWLILVILLAWFRDSETLERSGLRWAAFAALAGVVLWVLYRAGLPFGAQLVDSIPTASAPSTTGVAAYGLSYEPNLLGSTMSLWVFIALTGRVTPRTDRIRMVVIVAGLASVYLSLSRAPLFALAAGLLVWFLLDRQVAKRRVAALLGLTVVAVVVLSITAPNTISSWTAKLAASTNFAAGSGGQRYSKAQQAVTDLQGNWFAGLGLNSFGQRHLETSQVDQAAYLPTLPLQILYDAGLIGVILITVLVASLHPLAAQARSRRARGCGLIVVYAFASLATSPFWFGSTWLLVALAIRSDPYRARAIAAPRRGTAIEPAK
jgi:hypothetical protein